MKRLIPAELAAKTDSGDGRPVPQLVQPQSRFDVCALIVFAVYSLSDARYRRI